MAQGLWMLVGSQDITQSILMTGEMVSFPRGMMARTKPSCIHRRLLISYSLRLTLSYKPVGISLGTCR